MAKSPLAAPLAELCDSVAVLKSRCDAIAECERADSEDAAGLEVALVQQAVQFERRRDRFRQEMNALRERNRRLELESLELQRMVTRLLEESCAATAMHRQLMLSRGITPVAPPAAASTEKRPGGSLPTPAAASVARIAQWQPLGEYVRIGAGTGS